MSQAYYTYRIHIANNHHVQVEKRSPQNEESDYPPTTFGYKGKLRQQIDNFNQRAHQNGLNPQEIKKFGEALFNALFNPVLCHNFFELYQKAVHQEEKLLRIELDIDEAQLPEVAVLPWEFMRVPTEHNLGTLWLSTGPKLIFSRRRKQWDPAKPIQLAEDERLRIALAVAAPSDLPPVEFQKVWDDLTTLAQQQADRIELLPLVNPANPKTIDEILEQKPHIFHFIGHGRLYDEDNQPVGQVALKYKELDEAIWIDAEYFSGLFNRHRPGIVLLQACEGGALSASQAFTGVASRIVQQNIPVVVAMQYQVTNSIATCFARHFYLKLAQGEPVDSAVQEGRYQIAKGSTLYNSRDFATPVIYMRVENGHLFNRPKSPELVNIPSPPAEKQKTPLLYRVLTSLNYRPQKDLFDQFRYKALSSDKRVAAFFISGPAITSGQFWLLNCLVNSCLGYPPHKRHTPAVKINIEEVVQGGNAITEEFLWEQLAKGSSPQQAVDKICELWQNEHVLIYLINVGDYLDEIMKVWNLLVEKAKKYSSPKNWLLLFLVNEKNSPLKVDQLKVMEKPGENWQPDVLVRLPELYETFEKYDIDSWLRWNLEDPALALLKPQVDVDANAVVNRIWKKSYYGQPVSTLVAITSECLPNTNSYEVISEWTIL